MIKTLLHAFVRGFGWLDDWMWGLSDLAYAIALWLLLTVVALGVWGLVEWVF